MAIRDIPSYEDGDGACGPGALYALLGGDRPAEHRKALRAMGWKTPRGLGLGWVRSYLENLGERFVIVTYKKDDRVTVMRWVKDYAPAKALLIAGHHWIATESGLVVCIMDKNRSFAPDYKKRRLMVRVAMIWD